MQHTTKGIKWQNSLKTVYDTRFYASFNKNYPKSYTTHDFKHQLIKTTQNRIQHTTFNII